jgi:hypothetical protein
MLNDSFVKEERTCRRFDNSFVHLPNVAYNNMLQYGILDVLAHLFNWWAHIKYQYSFPLAGLVDSQFSWFNYAIVGVNMACEHSTRLFHLHFK